MVDSSNQTNYIRRYLDGTLKLPGLAPHQSPSLKRDWLIFCFLKRMSNTLYIRNHFKIEEELRKHLASFV